MVDDIEASGHAISTIVYIYNIYIYIYIYIHTL